MATLAELDAAFFEAVERWAKTNYEWTAACLACDDALMAQKKVETLEREVEAMHAYRARQWARDKETAHGGSV